MNNNQIVNRLCKSIAENPDDWNCGDFEMDGSPINPILFHMATNIRIDSEGTVVDPEDLGLSDKQEQRLCDAYGAWMDRRAQLSKAEVRKSIELLISRL